MHYSWTEVTTIKKAISWACNDNIIIIVDLFMTALGNGRVMISGTRFDYSPLSKHVHHYLNQGGERVHSSSRLKVNRVGGWRPASGTQQLTGR
jgi:hypothetical protein